MLTGKTGNIDRIIGKVIGADHYMTKPFNPLNLLKIVGDILKTKNLISEIIS